MLFKEITDIRDIDLLLPIVESYSYPSAEMESIRTQMLAELSEAGDNRHIFVGLERDAVVAFIEIILKNADNDLDLANGKDIAHVHNLRVRNELQGKGIGRQMMAFAEDKARQLGKQCLTLGVDDTNARAVNLYEQLGYVVFKEVPGRTPDEKCLMMRKSIVNESGSVR